MKDLITSKREYYNSNNTSKIMNNQNIISLKREKNNIYSPICNKCYRINFISFNYIPNYISIHCFYCNKIYVYEYYKFIEILNNDNPLFNASCSKCLKSFNILEKEKNFYLIEENMNFFTLCSQCFNINNNDNKNKKIIKFEDLTNFRIETYKNEKNDKNFLSFNLLLNYYRNFTKINESIQPKINCFNEYEKKISYYELLIKNGPPSLQKKAEYKLETIQTLIKITKKIIENYNNFPNIISAINVESSLSTILNINDLSINTKYNINQKINFIKYFIDCNKYLYTEKLFESINLFKYSFLSKYYIDINQYIKDKNEPKKIIFKKPFTNILSVNFEYGEAIIYDLSYKYLYSEKVAPIYYNYNKKEYNDIFYQDILLYNYKNDKNLYYGTYSIKDKKLVQTTLKQLTDIKIDKIIYIYILNYGEDLFILGKDKEEDRIINYHYITNFKKDKNIVNYEIKEDNINNYSLIIYKETNIILRIKKMLYLFNKDIIKIIDLPKEIIKEINPMNNNAILVINRGAKVQYIKSIAIINNMHKGINEIIKILMKYNVNYNAKINSHIYNLIFSQNTIINKIFTCKKYIIKYYFRKIFTFNKNYFIVISSKHIEFGVIKSYFYISLFSFNRFEEITKIEIDQFLSEYELFKIDIYNIADSKIKIYISLDHFEKYYIYNLEDNELKLDSFS